MAYSELIKDYQKIRSYMRQFYLYGFKNRGGYDQKSLRSYDNEKRRVSSWLQEYMHFHRDANGKQVFLSVDSRSIQHNPLYKAFKTKSFTTWDITLHFYLLDILSEGKALTNRMLVDRIHQDYFSKFTSELTLDASTVRKKLQEYVRLGLLTQEKRGRDLYYALSPQNVNLAAWTEALTLASEMEPLGLVGSFLLDQLPPVQTAFRFKHHYILQALDSEILYSLLSAIRQQRQLTLICCNSKQETLPLQEVLPLKIYTSVQSGRSYLLSYNLQRQDFSFYRLDLILKIEEGPLSQKAAQLAQPLSELQQHLWGVSYAEDKQLEHVEMTLQIEPEESYVLQRLEREKRCGQIQKLDERTYLYTADVYDSREMRPWLRSFMGRILKLKSTNPELEEAFHQDLLALQVLYGGEDDALS